MKPTIAVDPIAKLQSLTPIGAPDERAWPVYREGLASLHVVDRETWHDPTRWRDAHPLTSREPGTDAWVEASNALAAHQDDLATLRRAAALPYLGIELNRFTPEDIAFYGRYFTPPSEDNGIWSRSAYSILLPHLAELQVAARWLACDAMHASADGDGARAVDDLDAIANLARQLRRPLFIDQLVSMACLALATDAAGTIVAKMPDALSAADLERLAAVFESAHNSDLRIDFEGERIAFEDFLQRIYSDDGNGDGHVVSAALESADRFREFGGEPPPAFVRAAAPALTVTAPSRREARTRFEEHVRAAEQLAKRPAWEWTQADLKRVAGPPSDAVADLFVLMRVGMLLNGSGLERSVDLPVHLHQRIDVVRLAIALRRFEREHGAWPASIDALDSRLVASTHDRSDGKPLRYSLHDGKPVIWSIGPDRIDDRLNVVAPGNVSANNQWYARDASMDPRGSQVPRGDVILWPPVEEKAEGFPTLLVF